MRTNIMTTRIARKLETREMLETSYYDKIKLIIHIITNNIINNQYHSYIYS